MIVDHYNNFEEWFVHPIRIKNCCLGFFNKPEHGGIWTSPKGSIRSWSEWCLNKGFPLGKFCYELELDKENMVVIDSFDDLDQLPHVKNKRKIKLFEELNKDFANDDSIDFLEIFKSNTKSLDFEKIKKQGAKSIHLTINGLRQTSSLSEINLDGWDVETVLILCETCINDIRLVPRKLHSSDAMQKITNSE